MMHVTLIRGTYAPTHCGVAHYTDRLRTKLDKLGNHQWFLTTYDAAQAACAPDVIGSVHNWSLFELMPLLRLLHTMPTDILHIQHATGTYGFKRAIFLLPLLLRATGWRKSIIITPMNTGGGIGKIASC